MFGNIPRPQRLWFVRSVVQEYANLERSHKHTHTHTPVSETITPRNLEWVQLKRRFHLLKRYYYLDNDEQIT